MIKFMSIISLMTNSPEDDSGGVEWFNWKVLEKNTPTSNTFKYYIFKINGIDYLEYSKEFLEKYEEEYSKQQIWHSLTRIR